MSAKLCIIFYNIFMRKSGILLIGESKQQYDNSR